MTYVMFDTVTVRDIPSFANTSADAVAGYVDGLYKNVPELEKDFPQAHLLTIAVRSTDVADCLDIETGDAAPSEASFWVKLALAHGIWRPCLYANRSTMPQVVANLKANGISRTTVRLWVADWTYAPHIPSGFDACQWTDRALGRNLDESLCLGTFFQPPPAKVPHGVANASVHLDFASGRWHVDPQPGHIALGPNSRIWEAKVGIDESTGRWIVSPLPFAKREHRMTYTRTIQEHKVDGQPLGRHVAHDPRSRSFVAEIAPSLTSVVHEAHGLPLTQVRGSCTAEALCGALDSAPDFVSRVFTQTDAEMLYDAEIRLEGGDPATDDPGGSGLYVCKAAKQAGLIQSYRHAFGLTAALRALVLRPVIFGVDWYSGFDHPDPTTGLVTISGSVRGGHEIVADELDVAGQRVGFWNSWGPGYGLAGRFYMGWDTLGQLLKQQGDATVPIV